MGFLSFFKSAEQTVSHGLDQVTETVKATAATGEVFSRDAKFAFERARLAAIDANADVVAAKAALQEALVRSRDLHLAAIAAAEAATKVSEDELVKFKLAVIAHTADVKTQESQIDPATVAAAPIAAN